MTHKVAPTDVPTWEQIKSQFTEADRKCMMNITSGEIDLWNCASVLKHADTIYERVSDGSMPPGKPWSKQWVQNFHTWWTSRPQCPPSEAHVPAPSANLRALSRSGGPTTERVRQTGFYDLTLPSGHRIHIPEGFDDDDLRRLLSILKP
jgi:hypothetical protein